MSFSPSSFSSVSTKPPIRGSFPLDHQGSCKEIVKQYLKCLKFNGKENTSCRQIGKAYLECRMNHGLMEKEDLKSLGFFDSDSMKENDFTDSQNSEIKIKSNSSIGSTDKSLSNPTDV